MLDDRPREVNVTPPRLPQSPGVLAEPLPHVAGTAHVQQQAGSIKEKVDVVTRLRTLHSQVEHGILGHGSPPRQAVKGPGER
jgi:hypothetical protein